MHEARVILGSESSPMDFQAFLVVEGVAQWFCPVSSQVSSSSRTFIRQFESICATKLMAEIIQDTIGYSYNSEELGDLQLCCRVQSQVGRYLADTMVLVSIRLAACYFFDPERDI